MLLETRGRKGKTKAFNLIESCKQPNLHVSQGKDSNMLLYIYKRVAQYISQL
ncbi:hypothetical protein Hsw_3880 [Hymenobacter swuensis DY53]|uniref:Uncharacterized protein n=1 Tax=Hymenobacter swuensis DY53 TaxID=1227739 RepID=W8FCS5_9BACT|nr:hypothetical protein Hsw_3880 [Hymenobacter swuensis DY53]